MKSTIFLATLLLSSLGAFAAQAEPADDLSALQQRFSLQMEQVIEERAAQPVIERMRVAEPPVTQLPNR